MSRRLLKIKAWNIDEKLMTRIHTVNCKRGQLYKEGYELFQFTGTLDKNEVEIYDGDILLFDLEKYQVSWDIANGVWIRTNIEDQSLEFNLSSADTGTALRLRHAYEAPNGG